MGTILTEKQKAVFRFIRRKITRENMAPTIREIAGNFGFSSTGTVRDYLHALAAKGYLRRTYKKARSLELAGHAADIPILGRVAAGSPQIAQEDIEGYIPIKELSDREEGVFALRVHGDSMVDKGIFEGDLVIVRRQQRAEDGDIVVALLRDEATVKIFRTRQDRWWLEPANRKYKAIAWTESASIIGRVLSVYRRYV